MIYRLRPSPDLNPRLRKRWYILVLGRAPTDWRNRPAVLCDQESLDSEVSFLHKHLKFPLTAQQAFKLHHSRHPLYL